MHLTKPARVLFLAAVVSSFVAIACGAAVKRDLSTIPAGRVGFDDMCGLQDYFDSLEGKVAKEPEIVSALDLEGGGEGQRTARGGKIRYGFEGDFLMKNVRRLLDDNYRRLPSTLATASRIEIEVRWAEKAGVRRMVTDEDAQLSIDGKDSTLPYQVCVSELLFGAPLYKQRQVLLGLPDPVTRRPLDLALDAGAPPDAEAAAPSTYAAYDGGAPAAIVPAAPPAAPAR
jgi:hypothetical protein